MMQTEVVRKHLFNVRFSDEEQDRLERVARHLGLNAANLIRMLVLEKARELGLQEPSAKTRVRRKAEDLAEMADRESKPRGKR